ncbi:hypothetical protein CSIM01_12296 [Colletotrichum simmondsii]|uniref:Uncharacterized protein n=1 Tax=Colletotrichum simmondsii TaxID=703756 RepID=A0A135RS05_9PEZI|nr:hypothetical protein CSIM01_12296 [Colletotrichum simmondsii]
MKENAIVYDDEDFVGTLLRDVTMMLVTKYLMDVRDKHRKLVNHGSILGCNAMTMNFPGIDDRSRFGTSEDHDLTRTRNSYGIVRELTSMKKDIPPSTPPGCDINHNGDIDCDRQVSTVQTPLRTTSSRGPLREGVHDVVGPSARSPSRVWINVQPRRFVAAKVAASSSAHVSVEKLHNGLRADGARMGDGASNQSGRRMLHGGFSTKKRVSTQQWKPAKNSSGTRLSLCSTKVFTIFAGTDSSPSLPLLKPKRRAPLVGLGTRGAPFCTDCSPQRRIQCGDVLSLDFKTCLRICTRPERHGRDVRCRCMARMADMALTSDLAGSAKKAPRLLRLATGELNRSVLSFELHRVQLPM